MTKIDPFQSPMQIDFDVESFKTRQSTYLNLVEQELAPPTPPGSKAIRGIFKFQLGTNQTTELVYCLSQPGQPRPDDFSVPKGSGRTLITLQRASTLGMDQPKLYNWTSLRKFSLLANTPVWNNHTSDLILPGKPELSQSNTNVTESIQQYVMSRAGIKISPSPEIHER